MSSLAIARSQRLSVAEGVVVHLGPAAFFVTTVALFGVSATSVLASFLLFSLWGVALMLLVERQVPGARLPEATAAEWREGLSLVFGKGVLVGGAVVVAGWWAGAQLTGASVTGWMPVFAVVLLTDAAYYGIHRCLDHGRGSSPVIRTFRRWHRLHHSVEHLDFLRGNVSTTMDTAVVGFQLPLVALATLAGLDLPHTLAAYALVLMLQATHHVNADVPLGRLGLLFMDTHAHKIHHVRGGCTYNHGAMLSVWDRAFGTYLERPDVDLAALHARGGRLHRRG